MLENISDFLPRFRSLIFGLTLSTPFVCAPSYRCFTERTHLKVPADTLKNLLASAATMGTNEGAGDSYDVVQIDVEGLDEMVLGQLDKLPCVDSTMSADTACVLATLTPLSNPMKVGESAQ
jgi:hypothetical protein